MKIKNKKVHNELTIKASNDMIKSTQNVCSSYAVSKFKKGE